MEALFAAGTIIACAAFGWLMIKVEFDKRRAVYREAAEELGLRVEASFGRWVFRMEGYVGPIHVTVEERQKGEDRHLTKLQLTPGGLPDELGFSLQSGGGWRQLFERPGEDHLVGDTLFDEEVVVEGPPREALARLDRETRDLLLKELRWSVTKVVNGVLTRTIPERLPASALIRHVETLAALLDHLKLRDGVAEALARNVARDPVGGVRLRNLEVLQDDFPRSAEAESASRIALNDEDPAVRLQGAAHLGEEGFPVLIDLVTSTEEPTPEQRAEAARHGKHLGGIPDHVRVAAFRYLLHAFDDERIEPIVLHQLEHGEGRVRRLAVQAAGSLRLESSLSALHRVLPDADEDTAVALAEAFGRLAYPTAEDDLHLLLRHPSARVRLRAASTLAACGTARSVEPLRAAVVSSRGERDLTRVMEDAIAAIQSRIEGAEAGQLSLAQTEAEQGALSLAGGGGVGDLSLAPGEPEA